MNLSGIFCAAATPFDHKGDLYVQKIRANIAHWNRTTLSGYLVCGAAGEGALLTAEEKLVVWEQAAEAADSEKLLLASAGAESVRETVRLIRLAAGAGYHAAAVESPAVISSAVSANGGGGAAALYYRSAADQASIPLLIHDNPGRGRAEIPIDVIAGLSEHPNIIGVVDGSASAEKLESLLKLSGPSFQVLSGADQNLCAALKVGAAGAVATLANAAPFHCLSILEAVRTREHEAAAELQSRAAQAVEAVTGRYGIAGLKYAMDFNSYYGGAPRPPLTPLGPEAKQHIEAAFRRIRS